MTPCSPPRSGEDTERSSWGCTNVAQLDALQKVVNDARSGDLEIDLPDGTGRVLTEDEVVASHLRRNRYLNHPLVQHVLAAPQQSDEHRVGGGDDRLPFC